MSKKARLLKMTYELFSDNGDSLSLSTIASAVNIKKASIYAHFSSKEDLLYHMINEQILHYGAASADKLTELEKLPLEKILRSFYLFNINYFHDPMRLSFWKHSLALAESPLKHRVKLVYQKIHSRNMTAVSDHYQRSLAACGLRDDSVRMFNSAYQALLFGTLCSQSDFEENTVSEEHRFDIFWKGLQLHAASGCILSAIPDQPHRQHVIDQR